MYMGAAFLHEKEVRFTIKRILLLAAVLVSLLYSVPAYAECIEPDFYDKLGKEAVNVIEDEDMLYVSGHEFGHAALGLGDIYDDSNKEVAEKLRTPMNGWDVKKATEADYYLIMSHKTWRNRYFTWYSSDSTIITKYVRSDGLNKFN